MGKLLLSVTLMFWWVMQLVTHAIAPPHLLAALALMMTTLLLAVAFSHFTEEDIPSQNWTGPRRRFVVV